MWQATRRKDLVPHGIFLKDRDGFKEWNLMAKNYLSQDAILQYCRQIRCQHQVSTGKNILSVFLRKENELCQLVTRSPA